MRDRSRQLVPALMLASFATAESATLRVPSEYPAVQVGVDAAAAGDTVLVAPGFYSAYETRGIWTACVFLKSGVVLRSEGGSGVTTLHMPVAAAQPTIIYGAYMPSVTTAVEGFTITSVPLYFAGVYVYGSGKITFRDCNFRDLVGYTNAGINVINGDLDVIDCEFLNCQTQEEGAGAGIYVGLGSLQVLDSRFEDCRSRAIYVPNGSLGDALWIEHSEFVNCQGGQGGAIRTGAIPGGTTIRGCVFRDNVDTGSGGGAIRFESGANLVEDCTFLFNRCQSLNGSGGAIRVVGPACTVRRCTFYGNATTNGYAGATIVFQVASGSKLERSIVAGSSGSAAVFSNLGELVISSCNAFWNNSGGEVGGAFTLSPTDRVVDPLFCDPVGLDFTLMETSPCLAEDTLGCGQIGAHGEGCGFVSVEETSWGKLKSTYREGGQR